MRLTRAQAIRKHCMECSGHSYREARLCTVTECYLYRYRTGSEELVGKVEKEAK